MKLARQQSNRCPDAKIVDWPKHRAIKSIDHYCFFILYAPEGIASLWRRQSVSTHFADSTPIRRNNGVFSSLFEWLGLKSRSLNPLIVTRSMCGPVGGRG